MAFDRKRSRGVARKAKTPSYYREADIRADLAALETRMDDAEADIADHETRIAALEGP